MGPRGVLSIYYNQALQPLQGTQGVESTCHAGVPTPIEVGPVVLMSRASLYRWLAANLELLGNGLVFVATTCAVLSKAHLSAGLVGFSVSAALQVPSVSPLAADGSVRGRWTLRSISKHSWVSTAQNWASTALREPCVTSSK